MGFLIIGMRMGKITTKIALISLLHKYNFECLNDRELEFDVHSVTLAVKGGINVRVTNRNIWSLRLNGQRYTNLLPFSKSIY